jgi:zinc transporter 1/2/3
MDLFDFKYVCAAIIFITTLFGNIGSLFVTTLKWRTRLEALAGGAFLGAGMMHLLPEASEELEKVSWLHYPLAPTITIAIFVIFTLIDLFSMSEAEAAGFTEIAESPRPGIDPTPGAYDSLPEIGDPTDPANSSPTFSEAQAPKPASRFGNDMSHFNASSLSLYFIVGMDSTIEGLALGILGKWSKTIAILIAIVAHKPVEAFAVALIVLKRQPTKLGFFLLISFYSLLSPIGIAIGMELRDMDSSLMLGIIESCSSGAFLFMGCHEWMEMFASKEGRSACEKMWHYCAFLFGIVWLCAVAVLESLEKRPSS